MLKLFRNRLWSQYFFLRIFTIEQNYEILTNIPNNQPSKSTLNELSCNLFVLADFQPLWKAFKANGSLKSHSNYNPFRLPLTTKKRCDFSFSDLKKIFCFTVLLTTFLVKKNFLLNHSWMTLDSILIKIWHEFKPVLIKILIDWMDSTEWSHITN